MIQIIMLFEADAVGLIFSDNGDAGGNIQRQDGLARFGSFGVFSPSTSVGGRRFYLVL